MPTPGLSLVGFMEEAHAIQHLQMDCVVEDKSSEGLRAEWLSARSRLSEATERAGKPEITILPRNYSEQTEAVWMRIEEICADPLKGLVFGPALQGITLAMIEVDRLLAYQFSVDLARSGQHCAHIGKPPTEAELFGLCLPTSPQSENFAVANSVNSVMIKSRNTNLRSLNAGVFNTEPTGMLPGFVGIYAAHSLAFVHVTRFDGRCFLHNGFHRAVGARLSGATHLPCVLRDVGSPQEAGIAPPGTFAYELLVSGNAPTLAHYSDGRAHPVKLKAKSRILTVSWSDYVMPDEE